MTSHQGAAPFGHDGAPEEEGDEGWRHNDCLDQEEKSQLLDGHEGQDGLEDPVDELLKVRQEHDLKRRWHSRRSAGQRK